MQSRRLIPSAFATTLLVACGSSSDTDTPDTPTEPLTFSSDIRTPDAGGGFSTIIFADRGDFSGGQVNNISTSMGILEGTDEVFGVAGVNPGVNRGVEITAGTVDYSGVFNLDLGERDGNGFEINGDSGLLDLTATFDTGTVTGMGTGDSGNDLSVSGTFAGTGLGGSVTYGGVTAELDGIIGVNGITAAFAGNTDDAALVGGISLNAVDP